MDDSVDAILGEFFGKNIACEGMEYNTKEIPKSTAKIPRIQLVDEGDAIVLLPNRKGKVFPNNDGGGVGGIADPL